jgi:hypothetical protein
VRHAERGDRQCDRGTDQDREQPPPAYRQGLFGASDQRGVGASIAWVCGPTAVAPVFRGGIGSWRVAGSAARVG